MLRSMSITCTLETLLFTVMVMSMKVGGVPLVHWQDGERAERFADLPHSTQDILRGKALYTSSAGGDLGLGGVKGPPPKVRYSGVELDSSLEVQGPQCLPRSGTGSGKNSEV